MATGFTRLASVRGLGLSGGPWYVVKKNIQDNAVYVSNGYGTSKQYGREIKLDEMHFISGNPWMGQGGSHEITFKNRHTPHFAKGHLSHIEVATNGSLRAMRTFRA